MSRVLQLAVLWLLPYLGPDETALQRPSDQEDWFDSLMDENPTKAMKWATSDDPVWMLDQIRDRVSERKLRLFACACCRRVWSQLHDERSRKAVEVAEEYADGTASKEQLRLARKAAERVLGNPWVYSESESASRAAMLAADESHYTSASMAAAIAARYQAFDRVVSSGGRRLPLGIREAELATQTVLIRCLVGNPFHPVAVDPSWLSWGEGTVKKLAEVICAEHRFADLPILADALEDAGCSEVDILAHCRGPGPHVRGCWVIDLLLSRG